MDRRRLDAACAMLGEMCAKGDAASVSYRIGRATVLEGTGPDGGRWFVKFEGKVHSYKSREAAVTAAHTVND